MKERMIKIYKLLITFTILSMICGKPVLNAQYQYPFQNPNLTMDERVDNIISLLTLEEKIDLIRTFRVSRLNINTPGSAEGIHQAVVMSVESGAPVATTSCAQVYGMGETWNPELIRRMGAVEGYEARYITQNENYKRNTLVLWGPTADLARDPRWGRTEESFGEDPFLTGTMVVSLIKGIQGDDPKYW
ncbi:beta-glucosidase, partial [bacterium]|nr:beta-glucosidase [bacterium]